MRILLFVAALNDLNILAFDIQNAYLTAKGREKINTIAGPEFDSEEGTVIMCQKIACSGTAPELIWARCYFLTW